MAEQLERLFELIHIYLQHQQRSLVRNDAVKAKFGYLAISNQSELLHVPRMLCNWLAESRSD